MQENIKLLDCTLRDGGQGLEDMDKNGIQTEIFTEENKFNIIHAARDAGVDIIELGCMAESNDNKEKFSIYQNIETISRYVPERTNPNQMFVGLYIGPDTDVGKIPEHTDEMVDGTRVILRYSELQKSLDYCAALAQKGYKVFVQPMLTMRYSDQELELVLKSGNDMGAYAVYFVDSYGYMNEGDVDRLYDVYESILDPAIHIGFHAHNNMDMAFMNAKHFVDRFSNRSRIVDACANGMGQGAGNLQTELIVDYLNRNYGKEYDFRKVLTVCDEVSKFRPHDMETWGYSPLRMVAAVNKAAYKYAVPMKMWYGMSLAQIHDILSVMPLDMKYRYTEENLQKAIRF